MNYRVYTPRFPLGQIVMTDGVMQYCREKGVNVPQVFNYFLELHSNGQWGDIPEEDKKSNDKSAREGGFMIMSEYKLNDIRIWVITESDRSATTFLFPEEY